MRIILSTGLPGSGKGILLRAAKELGLPTIVLGDIVREKASEWNIKPLDAGQRIRDELGPAGVAILAKQYIKDSEVFFVDGIRSWHEVEVFKELGEVVVIAIHASPKVRYRRLRERGREDDPKSWEEFISRDLRELSRGVAQVIAWADFVIENNDDEEEVYKKCLETLKKAMTRDP